MKWNETIEKYSMEYSFEKEETEVLEEDLTFIDDAELVVYNDDHNTFQHVISCFIRILRHTEEQAEQLSLIIHFNGKATVKTAPFKILKPYKDALIDQGLSAVIEK